MTVLDEWKNETHPDKNGKTEGIRTTKADAPEMGEGEAVFLHATDQKGDKDGIKPVKDTIVSNPNTAPRRKEISHEVAEANKAEPNVQQGVAGGEVPPQWTGSGSPYPKPTESKMTSKRKKLIKSYRELKFMADELNFDWSAITIKVYSDEFKEDGDNWEQQKLPDTSKKKKKKPEKSYHWDALGRKFAEKDIHSGRRHTRATPKKERQTHGGQSTDTKVTDYIEGRDLTYDQAYGGRGAPHGKITRIQDDDYQYEGGEQNAAHRYIGEDERKMPSVGKAPKDLKRKAMAILKLAEIMKKRKKAPHGESAADYEKYLDLDPIDENIENQ